MPVDTTITRTERRSGLATTLTVKAVTAFMAVPNLPEGALDGIVGEVFSAVMGDLQVTAP